jgi:hypothetical protein
LATIAVNRRPTSRYRAPVTQRHHPSLPPQAPSSPFRDPPPLSQFVLLSMLLHGLLIALFGAPSGGSREGRAMWGSMHVELRGPIVEPRPAEVPAPTRQDRPESEGAVPMTPPAETQAAAVAPSGPAIVEVPTPFPRLLDRVVRPETRLVDPPALVVPPPTEGRDLRPPPRERPAVTMPTIPEPLPISPNVGAERTLAEPPAITVPLAQPPTPAPAPAPAPVPEQRVRMEPEAPITRPVEAPPVEVRAIPVPTLESVVPRGEIAAPAPVELAPVPNIQAAPAAPPVERVAPRPAPAAPAPEVALPQREAGPSFGRPSAPGADRRRGRDDPAGSYDPTAPSVDLDAARRRAGEIAREGTGARAALPFPMPPVPAKKSQMETAIENARKPDCRTAYQGLGLLAVVPLVANEFGEGNCRW